jgi:stress response protein YsnF
VKPVFLAYQIEDLVIVTMELEDITTIPIVEERAVARKQTKVHEAVRARTVVHTDEEVVDTTVATEEIEVEQVALDRWVETPVPVRQEGDSTIITLHQEVVVTEKRLKVIGEVRMTKRRVTSPASDRVALRREEAVLERATPAPDENNELS